MKLLKIDRLRGLSIVCLIMAVMLLTFEISTPNFEATFVIVTMVILSTALEQVRLELRDLKQEFQNQRRGT